MQSRRDQVQAYFFVVGRLVSALVRGEPDAQETPLRRFSTGAFGGAMVAVILVAGVGIFGFISPGGSKKFEDPKTIIVEKETGNRFLLVDGALRPVLNYASALLIDGSDAKIASVNRKSLAGLPHGLPIGIPGAPDALPEGGKLTGDPWLACSPSVTDDTGTTRPVVTLQVGGGGAVGGLPPDKAILARTADGTTYLAWQDRRLRFAEQTALTALGYGNARAFDVAPAWINALPVGRDLRAPDIAGRGQVGPAIDGRPTRVGQVFATPTAGGQSYFVLLADGLSPATKTDAALVLGDPATAAAYAGAQVAALPLSPAAVAAAPRSRVSSVTDGFPPVPPTVVEPGTPGAGTPCARIAFSPSGEPAVSVAFGSAPGGAVPGSGSTTDTRAADKVVVPPGGGLIVRDLPAPGVGGGTLFLITDLGVKFPLASDDVAVTLGYGGIQPVLVPSTLLAFLPTGPALDPAAAGVAQPADGGSLPSPTPSPTE
jgi:type VII secretion protein EccB